MIPAEIVEKAAKAGFENYCDEPWEDVGPQAQANWCSDIDAALSAVYADIQAAAWDEGFTYADRRPYDCDIAWGSGDVCIGCPACNPRNPYRADELDGGRS